MEASELAPTASKKWDLVPNPLAQNTRQTEVIEYLYWLLMQYCHAQCRSEDNNKMNLREVGWNDADWIHSAQDRDQLLWTR
jgi:hypothetical protein